MTPGPDLGFGKAAADERVLLRVATAVEVNDLRSAAGEVTVTTRRIRFQPGRATEGQGLAFDDPNEAITGFGISGIRHRLEVRTATRTTRFMGDSIPALYAALQTNAEAAAGVAHADAVDYRIWPAALCRGPVMHPGAVVQTGTRIAFIATGLLDSLVGVQAVTEMPLATITGVALLGRLDHRIEIRTGTARILLACSDAPDHYQDLAGWLATRSPAPVWTGGAPPTGPIQAEIDAVLAPWRNICALPESPTLFTAAVGLSENSPATPGFLLVGSETMVWLPGGVPNPNRPPVSLPLGRERWIWAEATDEVRADRDGPPYRWITKAGKPFRQGLFDQVERIKQRIALAWASSGTGVLADGQNRRDSYRVQVLEQSQPAFTIWTASGGEFRPLACKVVELSLGGCSIRTATRLPDDVLLRVDLAQKGRSSSVRATAAYTRQRLHDQRWMAGLVFVDAPSDFDTLLRQLWMSLQQQQLRRLRGGPDTD